MENKSLFGGGTGSFFGSSTFNQPGASSTSTGLGFGATSGTSCSIFGNSGGSTVTEPFSQLSNTFGDNKPSTPGCVPAGGPSFCGGAAPAFLVASPTFGGSGGLATQQFGTTFKYNELGPGDYQSDRKGSTNQMAVGTYSVFGPGPSTSGTNTDPFHPTVPDNSFPFGQNKRTLEPINTPGFNNITGSLFGQQAQQHGSTFKMFGETTNTSLFSNNTAGQSDRSSMGFLGNTAGASSGGLFGHTNTATGLFGQTNSEFGAVGLGTQSFPTTTSTVTASFGNSVAVPSCFGAATTTPSLSTSLNSSSTGGTSSTFSDFGGNCSLASLIRTNAPVTAPSLSSTLTPCYSGAGLMGNKAAFTPETGNSASTSTTTAGVSDYRSGTKRPEIGLGSHSSVEVGAGQTFPWGNNHNKLFGTTGTFGTSSTGPGASHQPFPLVDPNAVATQKAMLQDIHSYLTLTPYGDSSLFRNTLPDLKGETGPQLHGKPVNASVHRGLYHAPPPPIRTCPQGPSPFRSSESQLLFYLDDDEPSLNKRPFRYPGKEKTRGFKQFPVFTAKLHRIFQKRITKIVLKKQSNPGQIWRNILITP
ncbi:nuclear pore complex protein Nup98-Nup96-like isoform X1 [Cynoglossus semilaevis]|uniref:nuclear pore complex protein Nup98-Nup96-like isoform X1 n=1 Tax=Cynoglossus semilaevis TaxID=244447 RepID=UPI000496B42A|nr:nuclear pore complex protein Nup98-Nup96-like isoform X1 [Cynoglossus semilaevis]